jgi:hypothetical protein
VNEADNSIAERMKRRLSMACVCMATDLDDSRTGSLI